MVPPVDLKSHPDYLPARRRHSCRRHHKIV